METPPGVEATERWQGNERLIFLLNHTGNEQTISLVNSYINLLDGSTTQGTFKIEAQGVIVLLEAK